jgi:hypothetical protein
MLARARHPALSGRKPGCQARRSDFYAHHLKRYVFDSAVADCRQQALETILPAPKKSLNEESGMSLPSPTPRDAASPLRETCADVMRVLGLAPELTEAPEAQVPAAFDDPGIHQPPHPPQRRGRAGVGRGGERLVGQGSVGLQQIEQVALGGVEFHEAIISSEN